MERLTRQFRRRGAPVVSHIDGNLWIGGYSETGYAEDFAAILNLYPWKPYPVRPKIDGLKVEMQDDFGPVNGPLIVELAEWASLIDGPLLIHCRAGLNRSALVAAYVLMRRGRSADEAISLLREKRGPEVLCNPTFETWLRSANVGNDA